MYPERHRPTKSEVLYNPERLEEIIQEFQKEGADGMHVLADVDRTLTMAESAPSIISQIRTGGYLGEDYERATRQLFELYHPIEADYSIKPEERAQHMAEWQRLSVVNLKKHRLTKQIFDQIIANPQVQFRPGTAEFFRILKQRGIPLILISGAPKYLVEGHMKQAGIWHNGIHVIANDYEFDENGNLIGQKEPIIHVANKSEVVEDDYAHDQDITKRRNVMLLGDNIDDLSMVQSFAKKHLEQLLSIGFLNDGTNTENRRKYSLAFDAVITNDGSMDFPNEILEKIIRGK
ncbi:MAG: HAD-IB family phosphatase [Candidatus Magasanikiibacteriota bacterium]